MFALAHIFASFSLGTNIQRLKHVLSNISSMYTACNVQIDVESQDYKRKSEIELAESVVDSRRVNAAFLAPPRASALASTIRRRLSSLHMLYTMKHIECSLLSPPRSRDYCGRGERPHKGARPLKISLYSQGWRCGMALTLCDTVQFIHCDPTRA